MGGICYSEGGFFGCWLEMGGSFVVWAAGFFATMDEKYWDKAAADYDGEIFSVLANDRNGIIRSHIRRFGSAGSQACDFGCGVGKFLPVLAESFGHVYAVDLSEELLQQARQGCKSLHNVTYVKKDLSNARVKLAAVDFALSVNVAIMASARKRFGILGTIARHLRGSGHLLLVVPSLESALFADFRLIQWNIKSGMGYGKAIAASLDAGQIGPAGSLRQGIVEIDGVPTKHYLREELLVLFGDRPFDVLSIEKVEYSWKTEFELPPRWMKGPYPWDWAVLLRKKGG